MKKLYRILTISLLTTGILKPCRNTISNNTNTVYKIAEIREGNKDLKKELYLPNEYLANEQKAHTLNPGEEVSFGGHYLPTFAVFKKYPDDKWHSLVVVKQNECGPRGPENKYLLITDVLRCKLPDDYNPVYTFARRKLPEEIEDVSKNKAELSAVGNPYQEIQNILDEATGKIMDEVSQILDQCKAPLNKPTPPAQTAPVNAPVPTTKEEVAPTTTQTPVAPTNEKLQPVTEKPANRTLPASNIVNELPDDDGKTCAACAA